jgi:hypothetical protein
MTDTTSNNPARPMDAVKHAETAYSSNDVRLSWWQWLIVAVIVAAALPAVPWAWQQREPLPDGPNGRVPYELSNDYWLFARYARAALADESRTIVLGDSVVWGHYVRDDQTLSHDLSPQPGAAAGGKGGDRFANLGVDGIHPAAMEGLLDHYGGDIRGRNVVLHLNLLWMSSDRHDLTTRKEFSFNHETLVPQFHPWIRCYRSKLGDRLAAAMRRVLPWEAFAQHIRLAYYDRQDVPAWSIAHPDECPVKALAHPLPSGTPAASPPADCIPWHKRGIEPFSPQWVELDKSLQWSSFRRTLEHLTAAGNRVFVLVGPFNEHMLEAESLAVYHDRLAAVSAYLTGAGVPHYVAKPLDSDLYADASHPLAAGYVELARQLHQNDAFAHFDGRGAPGSSTVPAEPRKGETK